VQLIFAVVFTEVRALGRAQPYETWEVKQLTGITILPILVVTRGEFGYRAAAIAA